MDYDIVVCYNYRAAADGDDILREEDEAEVLGTLWKAKGKAFELGLELKLPPSEVRSIRDTYAKPGDRLTRIVEMFLKQVEPTWRIIIDALRRPLVDLPRLAKEIEDAHFPNPSLAREIKPTDGKSSCLS